MTFTELGKLELFADVGAIAGPRTRRRLKLFPQSVRDEMLIRAAHAADPFWGRTALKLGAKPEARDFFAMHTLVEANNFDVFQAFAFTRVDIQKFADQHIEKVVAAQKNPKDLRLLRNILAIHRDLPPSHQNDDRFKSIQLGAVESAPLPIVWALLSAYPDGINAMLNKRRELLADKTIDQKRDDGLMDLFCRWVKYAPPKPPPFRPHNAWNPPAAKKAVG